MIAAEPITNATLASTRAALRRVRNGEPVVRPIPSPTIGVISGEISIAPITTPVLSSTSPRVAMPIERKTCSQYDSESSSCLLIMEAIRLSRSAAVMPKRVANAFCKLRTCLRK